MPQPKRPAHRHQCQARKIIELLLGSHLSDDLANMLQLRPEDQLRLDCQHTLIKEEAIDLIAQALEAIDNERKKGPP